MAQTGIVFLKWTGKPSGCDAKKSAMKHLRLMADIDAFAAVKQNRHF